MLGFLKKFKKEDEQEDLSILEELKGEHDLTPKDQPQLDLEPASNDLGNSLNTDIQNPFSQNQPPLNSINNNPLPSQPPQPPLPQNDLLTFANNQPLPNNPGINQGLNPHNPNQSNFNSSGSCEDEIKEIKIKIELIQSKLEKLESKLELIYNMLAYQR